MTSFAACVGFITLCVAVLGVGIYVEYMLFDIVTRCFGFTAGLVFLALATVAAVCIATSLFLEAY